MKDNISDFPGYYVTVDGKVYSRKNNRHGYLKDYHLLKTKYTKHDGRPYVTLRNPKLGIRRLAKRDYRKVSIRAHRRVIRLKSLGWSSSRIGKRFKVNRTCINRILNKYKALLKLDL